jgi:hypothetical protein
MNATMSRAICASVALLFAGTVGGQAQAVCLAPQPVRVCTEFFRSENVMVAKILSVRKIPDTPDPNNVEGWFYKIAVDKSYRGPKLPNDEIYTGNDETRFTMEVGKTYLLFLNNNPQSRPAPDTCGNSSEISKANDAVAAVDKILKAAASGGGGDIGGRVMVPIAGSQAISESGAPGISLTIQNYVGRDQTVTTDQDGRFDAHVPGGHYTVVGASETWDIVPYALSYMKPVDFELPDGACADLMFVAQPK